MNHTCTARMQEACARAKDLLDATDAQVEHGLELHRASVIVDCYGFNPRPHTRAMAERLNELAETASGYRAFESMRAEVQETAAVWDAEAFAQSKTAWDASGVTCIVQNVGRARNVPQTLTSVARFDHKCDRLRDVAAKALNADDVVAAKASGKHCYVYSLNGVPLFDEWLDGEDDMRPIRDFSRLGVRMMHLAYNRRNRIGDGCTETNPAGLSDFGRDVVAHMNRVGVIVDTAHCSWPTTLDAARASAAPMVASHTTCASIHHHARGKPDEILKAIADTGGFAGMCMIPFFLSERGTIVDLLDHIEHAVKVMGEDHVGVGADSAFNAPAAHGLTISAPPGAPKENWWGNWKPGQIEFSDENRCERESGSLCWTNFPYITVGLGARGFSDDAIQKIMGGNFLRVLRAVTAMSKD